MLAKPRVFLVLAGALALSSAIFFAARRDPDDRLPIAPPPPLEADARVELEARHRGPANRHTGPPIPGKMAHWVKLGNGRRIIVHAADPLDCPGVLVLSGRVLRRETSFQSPLARASTTTSTSTSAGARGVTLQLDVESARCKRAPREVDSSP